MFNDVTVFHIYEYMSGKDKKSSERKKHNSSYPGFFDVKLFLKDLIRRKLRLERKMSIFSYSF